MFLMTDSSCLMSSRSIATHQHERPAIKKTELKENINNMQQRRNIEQDLVDSMTPTTKHHLHHHDKHCAARHQEELLVFQGKKIVNHIGFCNNLPRKEEIEELMRRTSKIVSSRRRTSVPPASKANKANDDVNNNEVPLPLTSLKRTNTL